MISCSRSACCASSSASSLRAACHSSRVPILCSGISGPPIWLDDSGHRAGSLEATAPPVRPPDGARAIAGAMIGGENGRRPAWASLSSVPTAAGARRTAGRQPVAVAAGDLLIAVLGATVAALTTGQSWLDAGDLPCAAGLAAYRRWRPAAQRVPCPWPRRTRTRATVRHTRKRPGAAELGTSEAVLAEAVERMLPRSADRCGCARRLKPGHKSGRTPARPAAARALVPVLRGLAAGDPCGHYVDLPGPRQESHDHFGSGYHCPELLVRLVEHEVLAGALAVGEGGAVLDHAVQAQRAAGGGRLGDADKPGCPRQPDISLAAWLAGQYAGGHEADARPEIDAAFGYGGGVSGPGAARQPGFGAEM